MKLPLFPLSSHILPEGRMALRIFEPRYVRMIKETSASGSGFVICMVNTKGSKDNNTHIHPLGTVCRTIDFDLLEDGLLGITVEGVEKVKISNITTEHDELRLGDCETLSRWDFDIEHEQMQTINKRLKELFDRYPELSQLYDNTSFDDPVWVLNRWLELLPVGAEQKQHFLEQASCLKIVNYLNQLIE